MSDIISRKELFKNRSYACYAISAFLAMASYGMSYIALTWMVLKYNGGGIQPVVILMFCFWLPTVFLSPFAGVVVDRISRRKLFIFTSWSRGMLLLILGVIEWQWPSLTAIYIISLLEGVVSCFVIPAVTALIREIVEENYLLTANATIDMAYESGGVIGMAIAGFAIALLSNAGSLIADGLLFFVATLFAYGIETPYKKLAEQTAEVKTVLSDLSAGLIYIVKARGIFVIYTLELIAMVIYMVIPVLTAPFATHYLNATVAEFGYIEAALSVGVILGNFITPSLVNRFGLMPILIVFNIILAIGFALFAMNRNLIDAGILNFLIGIGFASWPLIMTRAQELTDIDFQGRVHASFSALSGVVMLLVYSLLYFDADHVPLNTIYYAQIILVTISLGLIISYRRLFNA